MIEEARIQGRDVVTLPRNIRDRLRGQTDLEGHPIVGLDVFTQIYNAGFRFTFIDEGALTAREREIYRARDAIVRAGGGLPGNVEQILISETMRPDASGRSESVLGLWETSERRIIVRRSELRSLAAFAGTLLHEVVHARSGFGDGTRAFEDALTDMIGQLAAGHLQRDASAPIRKSSGSRSKAYAKKAAPRGTGRGEKASGRKLAGRGVRHRSAVGRR